MASSRNVFGVEETRYLLSLISERNITGILDGKNKRNKVVFEESWFCHSKMTNPKSVREAVRYHNLPELSAALPFPNNRSPSRVDSPSCQVHFIPEEKVASMPTSIKNGLVYQN